MTQRIVSKSKVSLFAAAAIMVPVAMTHAALTTDLIMYTPLDETTAGPVVELANVGLTDGTNYGAVINQVGVVGQAYKFIRGTGTDSAGSSMLRDFGNFSFNTASTISFSVFINPTTTNAGGGAGGRLTIMGTDQLPTMPILQERLQMVSNNSVAGNTAHWPAATNFPGLNDDNPGTLNNWHHIAVTLQNTSGTSNGTSVATFYVDGTLAVTNTLTAANIDGLFKVGTPYIGASSSTGARGFDGLIDEVGMFSDLLTTQEVALINGLARFAGVALNDTAIDNVLAAFNAGVGNSAFAGGYQWAYASNLGTTIIGQTGGTAANFNAFIALDASGNGVQIIPEPASLILLSAAGGLMLMRRRQA